MGITAPKEWSAQLYAYALLATKEMVQHQFDCFTSAEDHAWLDPLEDELGWLLDQVLDYAIVRGLRNPLETIADSFYANEVEPRASAASASGRAELRTFYLLTLVHVVDELGGLSPDAATRLASTRSAAADLLASTPPFEGRDRVSLLSSELVQVWRRELEAYAAGISERSP